MKISTPFSRNPNWVKIPFIKKSKQPAYCKGWERPVHAARLEQKTGLPDSYIIAKTEVKTNKDLFAPNKLVSN